jgi:hypothetical protein
MKKEKVQPETVLFITYMEKVMMPRGNRLLPLGNENV